MRAWLLGGAMVAALVMACTARNVDADFVDGDRANENGGDDTAPGTGSSMAMCTIDDTVDAGLAPIGPDGCAVGSVIVYRKTLSSGSGGSAVASAGEAASADDAGDGGLAPMTPACAAISCGPGQVGVVTFASAPGSPPGPPVTDDASAAGDDGGDASDDGGTSEAGSTDSDASVPIPACPGFVIKCIDAPPTCPAGQSPSYAPSGKWHCMPLCDPNNPNMVVISYGGQFGATRICAPAPPQQACGNPGDVWTWDFNDEVWVCRSKCDNGMYDQHQWNGQTVCVPC
ncbi:MAG TPA: hypothetical protein VIF62_04335 [Labilithrix sp.]|jgi:hypothetical protein